MNESKEFHHSFLQNMMAYGDMLSVLLEKDIKLHIMVPGRVETKG